MIDVIALPALAILVVAYIAYIWTGWLRKKDGRAINLPSDDEGDDPGSRYD